MAREIKVQLALAEGAVGNIQKQINAIKGTAKVGLQIEDDGIKKITESIKGAVGKVKIPINIKVDGKKSDIADSISKKIGNVKVKITPDGKKSEIAEGISNKIGVVKIKIDVDGKKADITKSLSEKIGTVKVGKIDASDAIKNVRQQLQSMLSALSVKNGVNITGLKEFIGTEGVDAANKAVAESADKAVASMRSEAEALQRVKVAANEYKAALKGVSQIAKTTESTMGKSLKLMSSGDRERVLQRFQELETQRNMFSGQKVGNVEEVNALRASYAALHDELNKGITTRSEMASKWKADLGTLKTSSSAAEKAFKDANKYLSGTKELEKYTTSFRQLKAAEAELSSKEFGDSAGITKMHSEYQKYTAEVNKAVEAERKHQAAIKETAKANKNNAASMYSVVKLSSDIQKTLAKNTKLKGTSYEYELKSMMATLDAGGENISKDTFSEYRTRYAQIQKEATAAGKMGVSLASRMRLAYDRLLSYGAISGVFYKIAEAARSLYNNVVNIDTAMTQLRKVTDETESSYDKFFDRVSDRAKDIGATMSDTINASADFARLGYDIDTASSMADAALVYKNVGDNITDISQASESLTSTIQAFKEFGIEATDAMEVVDRFNEVGKDYCPAA